MKGDITEKQAAIFDYLKKETLSRGYPPSVREICQAMNLRSTSTVFHHLDKLEKAGYIRRDPAKPRAIEILDDDFATAFRETATLPVVGRVAAGQPILAEQNVRSYYPIPMDYLPQGQSFMLEVHGDSMIEVGIMDGDLIMVEECPNPRNGDIVVALIEDSATVKTYYREENHIRLQPENSTMDPIIVRDVKIMGRVFGVVRYYR